MNPTPNRPHANSWFWVGLDVLPFGRRAADRTLQPRSCRSSGGGLGLSAPSCGTALQRASAGSLRRRFAHRSKELSRTWCVPDICVLVGWLGKACAWQQSDGHRPGPSASPWRRLRPPASPLPLPWRQDRGDACRFALDGLEEADCGADLSTGHSSGSGAEIRGEGHTHAPTLADVGAMPAEVQPNLARTLWTAPPPYHSRTKVPCNGRCRAKVGRTRPKGMHAKVCARLVL